MDLSKPVIIIPSLDPDEKLTGVIDSMISAGFSRLVIVDDGSDDRHKAPFDAARALPQCRVVVHEVNRGKGQALRTAFSYVLENYPDCPFVITADGDGQHKASDAIKLAEAAYAEPDNVIMGCRCFTQEGVPRRSSVGNRTTSMLFDLLCDIKLSDTQTGFRAIPAKYLDAFCKNVAGDRFEYETNMILYMKAAKIAFTEVSIETVYIDENKSSHYRTFVDSFRIGVQLFKGSTIKKQVISSLLAGLVDIIGFASLRTGFSWVDSEPLRLFIATAAARGISCLASFLLNKYWVFKSPARLGKAIWRFATLSVGIMLASWAGVSILNGIFRPSGFWVTVIKCIVDGLLFLFSYTAQQKWVFKKC